MTGRFMIYGTARYMGKLVTRPARAMGLEPLLAGRNATRLSALAAETRFAHRVVDLADAPGHRRRDATRFQTSALAFGADFILSFPSCRRED